MLIGKKAIHSFIDQRCWMLFKEKITSRDLYMPESVEYTILKLVNDEIETNKTFENFKIINRAALDNERKRFNDLVEQVKKT